jgi:hypothetical protein
VQKRLASERDSPLLLEFARQRFREGLANFDPAARKMPAGSGNFDCPAPPNKAMLIIVT